MTMRLVALACSSLLGCGGVVLEDRVADGGDAAVDSAAASDSTIDTATTDDADVFVDGGVDAIDSGGEAGIDTGPDAPSCDGVADADASLPWPTWQDLGRPVVFSDGRVIAGGDTLIFADTTTALRWTGTTWLDAVPAGGRPEVLAGNGPHRRSYGQQPAAVLALDDSGGLLRSTGSGAWVRTDNTCIECPAAPVTTSSGAMLSRGYFGLIRAASFTAPWVRTVAGLMPETLTASGTRVLADDRLSTDDGLSFAALPSAPFTVAARALTDISVCAFGAKGGVAWIASAAWSVSPSAAGFVLRAPPLTDYYAVASQAWDVSGQRVFAFGETPSGPRLARSLDGCASWSFMALPGAVVDIAVTATRVFLTDGTDVWSSNDDGATFSLLPRPTSASIAAVDGRMTKDCELELVVSTGIDRTNIYERLGAGAWTRLPAPAVPKFPPPGDYPGRPKFGVWFGSDDTIFRQTEVGYGPGLWRSAPSGWTATAFSGTSYGTEDVISFRSALMLAQKSYSIDGGRNFKTLSRLGIGIDGSGVGFSVDGTTHAVFSSTDLTTWTPTGGTSIGTNVRVSKSGKLYALNPDTKNGYVSSDRGRTWTRIATRTWSFLDVGDDGVLYDTTPTGLLISWDGGLTASEVNGLPSRPGYVGAAAGKIIVNVDSTFESPQGGLYLLEPKP